jgi:ABC-type sugar transport system ATPase subunit
MSDPLLLRMEGIAKSFPGVRALRGVDLDLAAGEILALVGENGAGKSTLIKILGGTQRPDAGRILIDGREASLRNPLEARRAGVAVIHQELNLVPHLSAAANVFLGHEETRAGFVSRREEARRARELFARLGVEIDPDTPAGELSVGRQQIVEIAKAISVEARILVLDEPTAALTPHEADRLAGIVRDLRARGLGLIYISHRLDEIFSLPDRIQVMRDGERVACRPRAEFDRPSLIEVMVGRKLEGEFPPRRGTPGRERLVVRGLRRGARVNNLTFSARAGEILGLTGLVGAGRTETLRVLFGADRPEAGTIELDGRLLRLRGPRDAIAAGIALLTEDRKGQGLVLGLPVRENFGLPNLDRFSRLGYVDRTGEENAFRGFVKSLDIRTPHGEVPARNLSGGNQQKVVLAKWLERNCEVLLFDEPTRGIDVGAKREIYELMRGLADQGKVIVMVSSELPEVIGMADRILVMHDGQITGEIADGARATQEEIMRLALA